MKMVPIQFVVCCLATKTTCMKMMQSKVCKGDVDVAIAIDKDFLRRNSIPASGSCCSIREFSIKIIDLSGTVCKVSVEESEPEAVCQRKDKLTGQEVSGRLSGVGA